MRTHHWRTEPDSGLGGNPDISIWFGAYRRFLAGGGNCSSEHFQGSKASEQSHQASSIDQKLMGVSYNLYELKGKFPRVRLLRTMHLLDNLYLHCLDFWCMTECGASQDLYNSPYVTIIII